MSSMDTLQKVDPSNSEIVEELKEKNVRYILGSWIDILGRPRAKSTPIKHLPQLLSGFARYTPRGICGIGNTDPVEQEIIAIPDKSTLTVLPWDRRFAWMASDMWTDDGSPSELCPRSILKRQITKAAEKGYAASLGIEPEFYLFRADSLDADATRLNPVSHSAYIKPSPAYDVETQLDSADFLDRLVGMMPDIGLDPFGVGVEGGIGQYEIDFYHKSVLEMSDRTVLFKLMAHQVAKQCGLYVSFMPKPYADVWGSGAHFNMGLYRGEDLKDSVFRDKNKQWSKEARSYVAGILRHAPAITAIANPLVNSYKRLTPRLMDGTPSWAPVKISYGVNNRSCMVRLPENRPAIELRSADASANPYLVSAFMMAAGLEGIREGYDPGEAIDYLASDNKEIPELPKTLLESVTAFEKDPLSYEIFSEGFIRDYVDTKRNEWEQSHLNVIKQERDDYLLMI